MTTCPAQADISRTWLPYTLRWPCLLAILTFACFLEIIAVVVHSISWRNSGFVTDDGSGILQVGSKFAPTLLATVYAFLASILLDDVKRTEPFARLSLPGGARADLSVSWTADAWWDALFNSFPSRRKKTSWAMLFATLAFVLGFLIISPLSSSLIVPQTIILTEEREFFKINISPSVPIQAKPLSKTYYRSIGSILRNVSTSAWISDQYAVLPFWPASVKTAPLGPILFDSGQTWTATTSVFSIELSCEPLELKSIGNTTMGGGFTSIQKARNATLLSQKDCTVNLQYVEGDRFERDGGILWAPLNKVSNISGLSISGSGASVPPSCPQDELYVIGITSPENDIFGEVCEASYFMGDATATASFINGQSIVKIDEEQYHANRKSIPPAIANLSTFQDAFLSPDWSIHLSADDITKYTNQRRPIFFGPGNLLAALYDFSPGRMGANSIEQRRNITQRLKRRFFGELLLDCFANNQIHDPTKILGVIATNPRRLVVASVVAITLEVVLIVIIALLLAVFITTRLNRRPLGLEADPASTMSMAKMLSDESVTIQSFLNIPTSNAGETKSTSLKYQYEIQRGKLCLLHQESPTRAASGRNPSTGIQNQRSQRPASLAGAGESTVFSIWQLAALVILLTTTIIAVLALYIYSQRHVLYQKAFVYAVSVSIGRVNLGDVNPASVITTSVAVAIGLWWGSLDTTLRRTQPFLALAKGPVNGYKGVSISYRSSYLLWASVRAVRRRHWMLFLVCTGAFLSQMLTIAMSSLWSRQPGVVSVTMQVPKTLELRHVPILSTGQVSSNPRALDRRSTALAGLFGNMRTSWVYGAVVQLSLNGPEPPWSSQGWNFIPVDLVPAISNDTNILSSLNRSNPIDSLMTKVTLETPAIRGRLECSEYNLDNTTLWMADWRLPKGSNLDPNITSGYELQKFLYLGLDDPGTSLRLSNTYGFEDPKRRRTSLFTSDRRIQCCQNATNGNIDESSIGYWSPNILPRAYFPAISNVWPANFTIKWIRGHPREARLSYANGRDYKEDERIRLIWTERPRMAALNCMPIIETAHASVIVDAANGGVVDFKLLEQPQEDKFAWTDDFHGCATRIGDTSGSESFQISKAERLEEQTFNIRDPGLNVDYMTFAMLSLVNNNYSALLEGEILKETAQKTFSTFFQHFVNNNVSLTDGGYLYQSLDEKLPTDIGEPFWWTSPNTTTTPSGDISGNATNRMADMSISHPMEVLYMSEIAAWVCILILGYLIIACVLLAVVSKSYNRLLLRQVNSISDVAFLIAGSNGLLKIAREGSLDSLKYDDTVEAKLDWFVTEDGDLRWGIELVNKLNQTVPTAPSIPESNEFIVSEESSDAEEEVSWHDIVVSQIMAVGR
ncbi:hypothetical protein NUW58_g920 [Xylaria curta]|uniref:Uncharacterized protein n=1 Tax=Xylaria curta TaxID=42375 RepID=A0ACC1PQ53_9PEZI|nr:hypothetical protein NUW58_g920 [Xylaria curta]